MLFASLASAHATLIDSSPRDGSVVAAAPVEVTLTFNEPVSPLVLTLVEQSGRPISLPSTATGAGKSIRLPLPSGLPDGAYLLSYRVVSADSHPVAGTLAFTVGAAVQHPRETALAPPQGEVAAGRAVLRAMRDAALLIAVGAALFMLFVTRFPGDRQLLAVAAGAAALLALCSIPVQGAALLGTSPSFDAAAWSAGWHASVGRSAALAIVGSGAILAASFLLAHAGSRWLLLTGALLAVASLPLTGHAVASSQPALAMSALAIHASAAAFWLGSLLGLHVLLTHRVANVREVLQDFSRIAIVAVALLIVAGIGFAALQLASIDALLDSLYGQLVLLKAALLLGLVLIALRNRFVLMPRLERGGHESLAALRRAIRLEVLLIVMVLGATGLLTQTAPSPSSISRQAKVGEATAFVRLSPGRAGGTNVIEARMTDGHGHPLVAEEVQFHLGSRQLGISPVVRQAQRMGGGVYRYEGGELVAPGTWEITARARIGDFDLLEFELSVDLPGPQHRHH